MKEQAIKKLRDEMSKNNNPYAQVVGGFLLQCLDQNPEAAEKILIEGKTIMKSLDEMKKEASKKKAGNCVVLTDQEGFAAVLKYYGIEADVNIQTKPLPAQAPPKKINIDFDIKLDDLL